MYPYQRTPMGNPYISPIYPYIVGVYGLLSPRIPALYKPDKYHGYTVRGTPNCPLIRIPAGKIGEDEGDHQLPPETES